MSKTKQQKEEELNTKVNMIWQKIEFIDKRIEPKDLFNKVELKEGGKLILSLHDNKLKYDNPTNTPDFTSTDMKNKSGCKIKLNCNHDIVKSIDFSPFTLKECDNESSI